MMQQFNLVDWIQLSLLLLVYGYIFFRLMSLAIFKSWSTVCKYNCYKCSLFIEDKIKETKNEEKEKEEQKETQR